MPLSAVEPLKNTTEALTRDRFALFGLSSDHDEYDCTMLHKTKHKTTDLSLP